MKILLLLGAFFALAAAAPEAEPSAAADPHCGYGYRGYYRPYGYYGVYGKRSAEAEPEPTAAANPNAAADPWYGYGYRGYGYGGYYRPHGYYGYGYGKRSAEAE